MNNFIFKKRHMIFDLLESSISVSLIFWCLGLALWVLTHSQLAFFGVSQAFLMILLLVFLKQGRFSLRWWLYGLQYLWLTYSLSLTVLTHDWDQFFIVLFLWVVTFYVFSQFEKRILRADLNPRVQWFSALEPSLNSNLLRSGLRFYLKWGERDWSELELRCIDQKGLFAVFDQASSVPKQAWLKIQQDEGANIVLKVKKRSIWLEAPFGLGLEFLYQDFKDRVWLENKVNRIQGEGWV